jgi:hypothetical protein
MTHMNGTQTTFQVRPQPRPAPAFQRKTDLHVLPVFPLNMVLYPDGVLPLRIFETRYLDLVSRCLREDICFVVALITTQLSPIDFPTLLLSLSPGGLAEMSLIALALHIEVIAVVSHQFMRILIVNGFAVIVFRTISKMRKRQT